MKFKLYILTVVSSIFFASSVYAQCIQPSISSFSPLSASSGTTVTIIGNNFDATPSNNIVYFGAAKATVLTASTTLLTVSVPLGATYNHITVTITNCALTAYSPLYFNPISVCTGTFSAANVDSRIDYNSPNPNYGPYAVLFGDFDLDGKTDVVYPTGFGAVGALVIARNQSVPGIIDLSSTISLNTGGVDARNIAVADFDRDGKLDIVFVANTTNEVRIIRNTSPGPGNFSFAPPVTLITNVGPYQVAADDIDGDGKPDIAVTHFGSSNLAVFRNTSSLGSISFGAKQDFAVGGGQYGVGFADIDGDNKVEMVTTLQNNFLNVLRNTSSIGTISFAASQSFSGLTGYRLAIGDLNADGKNDIVSANLNSNGVTAYRNTSSPGAVSFASSTNLTVSHPNYRVSISDLNGDGKPDVVCCFNGSTVISCLLNTSTVGGAITVGAEVNLNNTGCAYALGTADIDGDGNNDVITGDWCSSRKLNVFRNNALGSIPVTGSVTPTSGLTCNSTLTINYTAPCNGANPGNVFTAQLSDATGSFSVPINIGSVTSTTSGTITGTIPACIATGSGYRVRVVGTDPATTGTIYGTPLNIVCQTITPASITTSAINPTTYCAGATLNVGYTATGSFGVCATNTFTAQLSDASGSFASPINIGSLVSNISGTIVATIPNNLPSGTSYRISVVSDQPQIVGTNNGTNISISQPPVATITPSGPTTLCSGSSVTLTATPGASWLWSTNQTTQQITVNQTGNFSVTVTNAGGCSASANIDILATSPIVVTAVASNNATGPVVPQTMIFSGAGQNVTFVGQGPGHKVTGGRTNIYSNINTSSYGGLWWTFTPIENPRHSSQGSSTGQMVFSSYDPVTRIITFTSTANMIWPSVNHTENIATRLRMQLQPYTGTHSGPIATGLPFVTAGDISLGSLSANYPLIDIKALGSPAAYQVWHIIETASGVPLDVYYGDPAHNSSVGGITVTSQTGSFFSSALSTCNGGPATVTVTATGGTGPYIGTGVFSAAIGEHTYTVTDANGCSGSATINIAPPTPIVVTAVASNNATGPVAPQAMIFSGAGQNVTFVGQGPGVKQTGGRTNIYSNINTSTYGGLWWTFTPIENPRHSSQGSSTTGQMVFSSYDPVTRIITFTSTANMIWPSVNHTENIATRLRMQLQPYTGTHSGPIATGLPFVTAGDISLGSLSANYPLIDIKALGSPAAYQVWHIIETASGVPLDVYYGDPAHNSSVGGITVTSQTGSFFSSALSTCNGGPATVTVTATGGTGPYIGTGVFSAAIGEHTYTVTDANGCSGSATINVEAQNCIELLCVENKTVSTDAGSCVATVLNIDPIITPSNAIVNYKIEKDGIEIENGVGSVSGKTFARGITTVTYTSVDEPTKTCSFTVTVTDDEKPTFICPGNQNINLNATCQLIVPNLIAGLTGNDNCGTVTFTQSPLAGASFASSHNQAHNVVITASDGNGNTQTCTVVLTGKDVTQPIFNCPSNQNVNLNGSCQLIVPNLIAGLAGIDNCGTVTFTQSPVAGASLASSHDQAHNVVITGSDGNGNTQTCTVILTGKDVAQPTFSCPSNQNVNLNGSCQLIIPNLITGLTGNDNCGTVTFTQIPVAGASMTSSNNQTHNVIITANDGNGNTSQCTVILTGKDITPPAISCPDNITVSNDQGVCNAVVNYSLPVVSDNCVVTGNSGTETFNYSSTIINWTVPQGVTSISIRAKGGRGGNSTGFYGGNGGFGASIQGDFIVTPGEVLKILVGGHGVDHLLLTNPLALNTGGGGGSFVWKNTGNNLLIAAGGGSGFGDCTHQNSMPGLATLGGSGNGGFGGNIVCGINQGGGGGTGWLSNGSGTATNPGIGGQSPLNGGAGGPAGITGSGYISTAGGFGGGGGGGGNCGGPGGGGGYTGGNGGDNIICTGGQQVQGGMSYNTGTNHVNITGDNGDHGIITISYSSNTGNVTQTAGLPSGSLFSVGTTTNTFLATDAAGNTSTCSFTVTVTDNEKPTFACPANQNVNLSNTCQLVVPNLVNGLTGSDNCGTVTFTQSPLAGASLASSHDQTHNVVITATDGNGNTQTCTVVLTGKDVNKPTFICPDNQNVTLNVTCQLIVPNLIAQLTGNDNCGTVTFTQSPVAGATFASSHDQTHNVVITASDGNGNTQTCTVVLTGKDVTKPTFTCPDNQNINLNATCQLIVPNLISELTGNDNCGTVTFTQSPVAGASLASSHNQTHNIVITASDGNGNTQTCAVVLTGKDIIVPLINCLAPIVVNTDNNTCGALVNYGNNNIIQFSEQFIQGQVSPHCGSWNNFRSQLLSSHSYTKLTIKGSIDPVGVSVTNPSLILQLANALRTGTSTAIVDNGRTWRTGPCGFDNAGQPAIELSAAGSICQCPSAEYIVRPCIDINSNNRNWGGAGTNTCFGPSQTLTVIFEIAGSSGGVTATDNCSLPTVTQISGLPSGSVFPVGITTNVFLATDAAGNTSTCSFTVTVTDNEKPTVTAPTTVDLECIGNLPAPATTITQFLSLADSEAGDNCTEQAALLVSSSDGPLVNGNCNGTITRTYTITDAAGNSTTVNHVFTVTDNTKPTTTAPATVDLECSSDLPAGKITIAGFLSLTEANANDNCTPQVDLQVSFVDGPLVNGNCNGSITRTYTITDGCGNATTVNHVFTVTDNTKPTTTAPATVDLECSSDLPAGKTTIAGFLSLTWANANDNCTPQVDLLVSFVDGPLVNGNCNGSITRTYTITDGCGNATTVNHVFTVTDNTKPIVVPPTTVDLECSGDLPAATTTIVDFLSLLGANANDNCTPQANLLVSSVDGPLVVSNCYGTITRTYTITDACSNTTTVNHVFTVTDNTIPVINTCPGNGVTFIRNTNAGVCTYQVAGTEFNATGSDNCTGVTMSYSIVNEHNSGTVTGTGSMAGKYLSFGLNTITWIATDGCGNTSVACAVKVDVDKITTTTTLTVNPTSQQYSDLVTLTATVTPNNCTGAGNIGGTVTFKIGSLIIGTAPVINGIATVTDTLIEDMLYDANLNDPMNPTNGPLKPGAKTVTAYFSGTDADYLVTDPAAPLTVTCENADITYNGQTYFSVSPNTNAGTVVLSNYVVDKNDTPTGARGDIRNATATFWQNAINGSVLGTANVPVGLVNPTNKQEGFVTTSFNDVLSNTDISNGGKVYEVWSGLNNYYCENSDTYTPVTLGLPGQDFVTGGGYIVFGNNSAGTYAGTPGKRMNFGFVMKWNSSGKNLQGRVNVVYRKMVNGVQRIYQIKSNAINSLVVENVNDAGSPATGTNIKFRRATISTKANLADITDPLNPISLGGNLNLTLIGWESTTVTTGALDRINVQLSGSGSIGLLFSSNWVSGNTSWQTLNGGKIQVRNPSTPAPGQRTTASEEIITKTTKLHLLIKAFPNPSDNYFNLLVEGNRQEDVVVTVYNVSGVRVHLVKGNANRYYKFGEAWIPGTYFVEVRQGNELKTVKLIKQ